MDFGKRSIYFVSLFLIISIFLVPSISYSNSTNSTIYFFWGEGCPHCEYQKPFLASLQQKYEGLRVESYEVWKNRDNIPLFLEMAEAYGTRATAVPTTFLHDRVWVGYSEGIGNEIEDVLISCLEEGCINPLDRLDEELPVEEVITEEEFASGFEDICIHVFVHGECLQCGNILPYLDTVKNKYGVNITIHDIIFEDEKEKYGLFKELYGLTHGAHPIVFIGETFLIGQDKITENLEDEIISCLTKDCGCPTERIRGLMYSMPGPSEYSPERENVINIPLLGEFDLSSMSLGVITVLISFVDGFNPCSLWVLTFLLGIVIYTGSKKKIMLVGLTYLLVTSLVYGLFIVGMLNVFTYIGFVDWIRIIVSLFALTFAVVNIKDFFWYKKGPISFTIPDKYKPKIFKSVRGVMDPKKSTSSMLIATIIMALGITLVELPCTAGFPVLWTGLVAAQGISMLSLQFAVLLAIYLLVYLSVELVIFFGAVTTLQKTKFEEKHGRILKLIGGSIMLALGLAFAFKPEYMESMSATFAMFTVAILGAVIVGVLYDKFVGLNGKKEKSNKTEDTTNVRKKRGGKK